MQLEENIYFDVAHNNSSFISLCNFVQTINGATILILALQQHKIINDVISNIEIAFDEIIITQTNVRNYKPAQELQRLFSSNNTTLISNPQEALKLYKTLPLDSNIIIAGSHYLGPLISSEFKISFENI